MKVIAWIAVAWAAVSLFLLLDTLYWMKTGHNFW
jgi:hypothetical protein